MSTPRHSMMDPERSIWNWPFPRPPHGSMPFPRGSMWFPHISIWIHRGSIRIPYGMAWIPRVDSTVDSHGFQGISIVDTRGDVLCYEFPLWNPRGAWSGSTRICRELVWIRVDSIMEFLFWGTWELNNGQRKVWCLAVMKRLLNSTSYSSC